MGEQSGWITERKAQMDNGSTQRVGDRWNRKRERERNKDVTGDFRTAFPHGASRETSNRTATCYNTNKS